MTHPVRDKMNRALKAIAVPALKQLGFNGSYPNFRRVHAQHVDLAVFQFNKYGGSFVVEIAIMTAEDAAPNQWRKELPLEKASVRDAGGLHRQRLGALGQFDHWFQFGKQNDEPDHEQVEADDFYEKIAKHVADALIEEGVAWWKQYGLAIQRKIGPNEQEKT